MFWLFEANDGFVARLQDLKLQSWADTETGDRHAATCTKATPMQTSVNSQLNVSPSGAYYQNLVLTARAKARFWGKNQELVMAARWMLNEKSNEAARVHTISM